MISTTNGVRRATNDRNRSIRAGITASSLKTGMMMLSSGPPMRLIRSASSVSKSDCKTLGISEQACGASVNAFLIDRLIYPQIYNAPREPVCIRALIRGPEKLVDRPVQVRQVKAIVANSIAECDQFLRKVHQERISPTNAALTPRIYLFPGAILKRLLVLLTIDVPVMKNLRQTCPVTQKQRWVLHAPEVQPSI